MKSVESSTPTEVFVKINEQAAMGNDKLHLNLDVVAVKDGQTAPNQKIILELNGKRKTVVTPDNGILKEHDIMFDCVVAVRNRLVVWAEESGIKTELDIVPENFEQKIKQDALTEANKKYSDQVRKAQEEVAAHRQEIERLQVLAGLRAPIEESPKEHGEFIMRMEADYHKILTALEKFGIQKIGIPEWLAIKSSLTKETIKKILGEISDPTLLLIPPISHSVWIEAMKRGGKTVGVYADIADEDLWRRNSDAIRSAWKVVVLEGSNEPVRKFSSNKYSTDKCVCTPAMYFALAMKFLAEGQRFDYTCKTILNYIDEQKIALVGGLKPDHILLDGFLSFEKYTPHQMEQVGIRYYVEVSLGGNDKAELRPKTFNLQGSSVEEKLRKLKNK